MVDKAIMTRTHRIRKTQDFNLEALELENKFQEDQIQICHLVLNVLPVETDLLKA